jgi:pre-mRNA-splicing factor RBM22/SLT11
VYRWRPGKNARQKKTELCRSCAQLKNCCQTCILDLEYGLPLAVRDSVLAEHEKMKVPESRVGRGYMLEQYESKAATGSAGALTYANLKTNRLLERLRRREPNYRRNLPHICSFFQRGECNRAKTCPYRHVMKDDVYKDKSLGSQNFKDRYYGKNDPVAQKMLSRAHGGGSGGQARAMPDLPADNSITTLFVGGVDEQHTENDLRNEFFQHGEVANVRLVPEKHCAFVEFYTREGAEEAMRKLHNKLTIKGGFLRLAWGKSRGGRREGKSNTSSSSRSEPPTSSLAPPPGMSVRSVVANPTKHLSAPPGMNSGPPGMSAAPRRSLPPPGMGPAKYPSMNSRNNQAQLNK